MGNKKRGKHGGTRPGAGRPKGAKDKKIGGRHTEGTRRAMTMDTLSRINLPIVDDGTGAITQECATVTATDVAKGFFAVPSGNESLDAANLSRAKNLTSERRREWSNNRGNPGLHGGYEEICEADDQALPEPPLCPGGEHCPDSLRTWDKHWHCVDCSQPSRELRPARLVHWVTTTESGRQGMTFEFKGWFCASCLWKRQHEKGSGAG
jgi:hypothetical protein